MNNKEVAFYKIYCLKELEPEQTETLEKIKPLTLVLENKQVVEPNNFYDYVDANYFYYELYDLYLRKDYFKKIHAIQSHWYRDPFNNIRYIYYYVDGNHISNIKMTEGLTDIHNLLPILYVSGNDKVIDYIDKNIYGVIELAIINNGCRQAACIITEKPLLTKRAVNKRISND